MFMVEFLISLNWVLFYDFLDVWLWFWFSNGISSMVSSFLIPNSNGVIFPLLTAITWLLEWSYILYFMGISNVALLIIT